MDITGTPPSSPFASDNSTYLVEEELIMGDEHLSQGKRRRDVSSPERGWAKRGRGSEVRLNHIGSDDEGTVLGDRLMGRLMEEKIDVVDFNVGELQAFYEPARFDQPNGFVDFSILLARAKALLSYSEDNEKALTNFSYDNKLFWDICSILDIGIKHGKLSEDYVLHWFSILPLEQVKLQEMLLGFLESTIDLDPRTHAIIQGCIVSKVKNSAMQKRFINYLKEQDDVADSVVEILSKNLTEASPQVNFLQWLGLRKKCSGAVIKTLAEKINGLEAIEEYFDMLVSLEPLPAHQVIKPALVTLMSREINPCVPYEILYFLCMSCEDSDIMDFAKRYFTENVVRSIISKINSDMDPKASVRCLHCLVFLLEVEHFALIRECMHELILKKLSLLWSTFDAESQFPEYEDRLTAEKSIFRTYDILEELWTAENSIEVWDILRDIVSYRLEYTEHRLFQLLNTKLLEEDEDGNEWLSISSVGGFLYQFMPMDVIDIDCVSDEDMAVEWSDFFDKYINNEGIPVAVQVAFLSAVLVDSKVPRLSLPRGMTDAWVYRCFEHFMQDAYFPAEEIYDSIAQEICLTLAPFLNNSNFEQFVREKKLEDKVYRFVRFIGISYDYCWTDLCRDDSVYRLHLLNTMMHFVQMDSIPVTDLDFNYLILSLKPFEGTATEEYYIRYLRLAAIRRFSLENRNKVFMEWVKSLSQPLKNQASIQRLCFTFLKNPNFRSCIEMVLPCSGDFDIKDPGVQSMYMDLVELFETSPETPEYSYAFYKNSISAFLSNEITDSVLCRRVFSLLKSEKVSRLFCPRHAGSLIQLLDGLMAVCNKNHDIGLANEITTHRGLIILQNRMQVMPREFGRKGVL